MTTPTPIPLSIRAYKYLGYLSLLIAGIGLIFGIASLFNDPIKNIKEYSPGSSEKLSFVTKATKIQDFTFFKVVSSGRRSTNTLKYHRINTGKYEFILEFNSDNGNPEYSKKIYLDNDIKASAGDIETLSTETKYLS